MIYLSVGLAAALIVVVGAWWRSARPSPLTSRIRRRCFVTCKNGASFAGVLWETHRQAIVLRDAQHIVDGVVDPVDGEVVILVEDVAFVQVP